MIAMRPTELREKIEEIEGVESARITNYWTGDNSENFCDISIVCDQLDYVEVDWDEQ